jgi:MoxR-like ATPase
MTTRRSPSSTPTKQLIAKLGRIRDTMNSMALERERENEGMLIALLSGTSCFLLGEPGTGKTFQIRLMGHLFGLNVFDTLLQFEQALA